MASFSEDSISLHSTQDGSHTLYSLEFGQFYHNPNGAIEESRHVFFDTPGLLDYLSTASSLTIFEVGFGTGLNFLLLADYLAKQKTSIPVSFYSIEAFPISKEIANSLNYTQELRITLSNQTLPYIFDNLDNGLNTFPNISDSGINLYLFKGDFFSFDTTTIQADFIFHDPFSPEVNQDLWTVATFEKLRELSHPNTILTTYCAASRARAAMAKAEWKVARAKGALGKREMTLSALSENMLSNFKLVNAEKLIQRLDMGDFD